MRKLATFAMLAALAGCSSPSSVTPLPSPTHAPSVAETPKPAPDDPVKVKRDLENMMTDTYLRIKRLDRQVRSLDKDPTESQKGLIKTLNEEREANQEKFDGLQGQHVKLFGSPFRPEQ